MEALHLPNAKLLYTIAGLVKDKSVTTEESRYLKDLVISGNGVIMQTLADNPSEMELKNRLLAIIKKQEGEKPASEQPEDEDLGISIPQRTSQKDEITSPVDTMLFDAKRKALYDKTTEKTESKNLFSKNMNQCNYGQSPVMQKNTLLEKEIGYQDS